MTYEQSIHDCDEHEGCTLIVCTRGGQRVWASHFDDDMEAAARLSPDLPEAVEKRKGRSGKVTQRRATPAEKERLERGPSLRIRGPVT